MNLNDKLFLITGASSGIGAATARAAARQGARVVLLARSAPKLASVADEIKREGGAAYPFPIDLTDAAAVQATAQQIIQQVGVPDILLNNAGAGQWLSTVETSPQDAVEMMAAPYFAAFFTTRAFLPAMLERNRGVIANMTSVASRLTWPGATAYTAGRWAMRGFTEGLRADLSRSRLRVMLVTFAKVQSDYWANNPGSEARLPKAQAMIPVLTPEAAADAILFGRRFNQREVMAPLMLRVVIWLNALFPDVTRLLMNSTGWNGRTILPTTRRSG
jgi:NADP-dependent 3-hydroxy acid dehydrogenase YdfG